MLLLLKESEITYVSVIKFRLHSHDVPYGSGSGLTGFPGVDDANNYWVLLSPLANVEFAMGRKVLHQISIRQH
ncbi:hypothetical protein SAY86_002151 [Trapa natans]|uniref:Uncharacterized protein n=1 Tax=Trapa natans TaxID=22666 RepID=A0AAN7R041_TRANT|nr:hypothetical protein SAY86_002151 [Trapa natans]